MYKPVWIFIVIELCIYTSCGNIWRDEDGNLFYYLISLIYEQENEMSRLNKSI